MSFPDSSLIFPGEAYAATQILRPYSRRTRPIWWICARHAHRRTHERDQIVALRPLATRCLVLLVKRAGRLVTLEQIRRELWGTTVVDWNAGIHQAIRQIRRALEDHDHAIVETVTRHGYRFRQQVESVIPMGNDRNEAFSPPRRGLRIYAAGFSTPIVLGSIFFLVCGFAF